MSQQLSRLVCLLFLWGGCAVSQFAQTTMPAELNITVGEQRVKFAPTRSFQEMRYQVFNDKGELVCSAVTSEAELLWALKDSSNNALAPGLYRYTLTVKYAEGVERPHQGHFIIEQAQNQLWWTSKDSDEISGAALTAAQANGRTIAGARSVDDKASTIRDVSGRTVEESKNGAWQEDPNKNLLNVGGSGTIGKLTKWTTATDVGDSILAESGSVVTATGSLNVTGNYQVGGQNALNVKVAQQSVFIGPGAGAVATGLNNMHIGTQAGANTTSGLNNTFIGTAAGQANTVGVQNNAIGTQAGANLSTGNNNTFIGNQAGYKTTSGINNMMIGTFAGFENLTGSNNTMIGLSAGQNSTAQSNTMIGVNAGLATTTGGENMFIGVNAGATNTTGSRNLLIGTNSRLGANNLINAGALGYAAQVNASNALVLGSINGVNGATADTNVGIGTTTPAHKLDVAGVVNTTGHYNISGSRVLAVAGANNLFAGIGTGTALTTGTDNTFIGFNVGTWNTNGNWNTFIGQLAGLHNGIGSSNTFLGDRAGTGQSGQSNTVENTFLGRMSGFSSIGGTQQCADCGYAGGAPVYLGSQNTFVGFQAGYSNTTADSNTFSGTYAGYSDTTGSGNTFTGRSAGFANTTGFLNTFQGIAAGYSNTTGHYNTFTGAGAGYANTTGSFNTFNGLEAGRANTTGSNNTFYGISAGTSNTTGFDNTFSGADAGRSNTTGAENSFTGKSAGYSNTSGYRNTFTGYRVGYANTTGFHNTFNGSFAGGSNTTGHNNTFSGLGAGSQNTTGNVNTFIGSEAGSFNSTGHENMFSGYRAGYFNTTGYQNTFSGSESGFFNSTGIRNTFIGSRAGLGISAPANETGNFNTAIGFGTSVGANNGNANAIGVNAFADCSNCMVLGAVNGVNGAGSDTRVGIGVNNPNATYLLHVNGAVLATSFTPSDARYKRDVQRLPNALQTVMRLRGVSYDFNRSAFPKINFIEGRQIGFLAQEVEQVIPEAVSQDHAGYYALNYSALVPLLTEAIKEQQQQTEQKDARIRLLEQQRVSQQQTMHRQQQLLTALQQRLETVERALLRKTRQAGRR